MKLNPQYILIADYVPLANKGEEAIIRGIEDMLRDERPVKIGLFDNVEEITHQDNITIFPSSWIFCVSGKALSSVQYHFRNILISLQMRLGCYSKLTNLISSSSPKYRPLQDFFKRSEYILVGHNGVFGVESCGIIHLTKKAGKRVGILGSGQGLPLRGRFYLKWLYARAMNESDFCVFREHHSYENMKQFSREPAKAVLAPDPAFAMRPALTESAVEVLNSYALYRDARQAGRSIVAVTVREKGITYSRSFLKAEPSQKIGVHAEFVAKVLDYLIQQRNVFVLFLPHAIERDKSDVDTARHVAEAMTCEPQSYEIVQEDLGARVLKSIIRECDFVIGERAHSIISSVSVTTPFVALTNTSDFRTHGIIGLMCRCEEQIIDMDFPDVERTRVKVLSIFDHRQAIRKCLEDTTKDLSKRLEDVSAMIKGG